MTKLSISQESIAQYAGDALVVGMPEGQLTGQLQALDKILGGAISRLVERKQFTGEPLKVRTITTLGKLPTPYVILVGLGKEPNLHLLRKAAGSTARICRDLGAKKAGTALLSAAVEGSVKAKAQAVAEGALLGLYQFTKYKTVDKDKQKFLDNMELLVDADKADVEEGSRRGSVIATNVRLTRDLVNEPASSLYPEKMEEAVRNALKDLPVKLTAYGKKDLEKMGMGGILAVNKGSVREPRLLVLDYEGAKGAPLALVGKGVTFDSGGLSLKPADYMEDMKSDMAGAAAVFAAIKSAAELKLPVHVLGFLSVTENLPGGDAYKPGDIIKAYNGKTIEVLNTDAEGRIVLADALSYAETFKPSAIIDLATLTGACVVALGNVASGVMGTDQKLISTVLDAAGHTDDRAWQLPLYDEYSDMMKSDFADLKNISGKSGGAGAETGAAFLKAFVDKTPWCHLDIAGPAWIEKDGPLNVSGGTGAGVRLLVRLLEDWK
ncbi:leucyl aminopeptidase [Candidatus Woesearchaeota archaeon]|nr:leucyl aminopeptidase [Candidatus Woesearchaeota archaeon]